ncbi:hypothetical protein M427DRAFT_139239 [Gonapodya prolifera JEL478]|uniref:Uncharacterized protein n=1 Tax=Gonapodya prolifera (strain JEL478) TaxID=1344416 RepID=A0A139A1Q4_GONPJ|nr:hypothetical protein M427DRAFT_139239 [Gonapodya prolifera JEL478]|eukprot:KXS10475.1 hypothetical protein M427DRAFT_139239 [Gonapodya prolifera JEL478]
MEDLTDIIEKDDLPSAARLDAVRKFLEEKNRIKREAAERKKEITRQQRSWMNIVNRESPIAKNAVRQWTAWALAGAEPPAPVYGEPVFHALPPMGGDLDELVMRKGRGYIGSLEVIDFVRKNCGVEPAYPEASYPKEWDAILAQKVVIPKEGAANDRRFEPTNGVRTTSASEHSWDADTEGLPNRRNRASLGVKIRRRRLRRKVSSRRKRAAGRDRSISES